MEITGYLLAIVVGISLGLIGGGGSILTVPVLVYLFAVKPELATSYSLFIVGISALIGAYKHFRIGNLNIRTATIFGLPSIISLVSVRKFLLPQIPNHLFYYGDFEFTKNTLLMVVFAALMITASISMIKKKKENITRTHPQPVKLVLLGLLAGFVTGFLGAGGGFLIIPMLVFFGGLEMKQAVGTSLLIMAVNASIGFIGDLIIGIQVDLSLLLSFASLAIAGIFIGTYLSKKIDGNKLKPIFGWFVLLMGISIVAKEIFLK